MFSFSLSGAGYEMEKRAAMQGNRYCPGVIQPVYNRYNRFIESYRLSSALAELVKVDSYLSGPSCSKDG